VEGMWGRECNCVCVKGNTTSNGESANIIEYRTVSGAFQTIGPPHPLQRVCPPPVPKAGGYTRGLQFYTFFGISIGITRRMIAIGKKITFYFLQNV
jgi:hypothetical protein